MLAVVVVIIFTCSSECSAFLLVGVVASQAVFVRVHIRSYWLCLSARWVVRSWSYALHKGS